MSNLKDLTWEHHKDAERQQFVKVLMSGKINPDLYATYLWNQHKKYDLLEALAGALGLLDGLPDIRRKQKIEQDFLELWKNDTPPVILNATKELIFLINNNHLNLTRDQIIQQNKIKKIYNDNFYITDDTLVKKDIGGYISPSFLQSNKDFYI